VSSGNAKIFDAVVLQILQGATAKALAASVDPVYSCWVFSAVLGQLASRFELAQLFSLQEAEAVVETIESYASYELDCQDEDFSVDSGYFTATLENTTSWIRTETERRDELQDLERSDKAVSPAPLLPPAPTSSRD